MGVFADLFNKVEEEPTEPSEKQVMSDMDKANDQALDVLDYLKGNEGFRSAIYLDTSTKGKPKRTTGYGFNLDDPVTASFVPKDILSGKREITKAEANMIIQQRSKLAIEDAQTFMGGDKNFRKLSRSQKKGIIDMAYHLGLTSLNGFDDLRTALFQGDKLAAKKEVLDSKYALEDTPSRAKKNANLMLK